MKKIDINVDVAEGFLHDARLLEIATSANVCCGVHAGDATLTLRTVSECRSLGVRVGAHVGVGDRANMGRSPVPLENHSQKDELLDSLLRQASVAEWVYVKPHGWLYNASTERGPVADVIESLIVRIGLPLMGLAGTCHEEIATSAGVALIAEGFADRRYLPDGALVPRSQPDAVLRDLNEIADQALRLAGTCGSLCIHGDTPGCVEIARAVRKSLEQGGYEVTCR